MGRAAQEAPPLVGVVLDAGSAPVAGAVVGWSAAEVAGAHAATPAHPGFGALELLPARTASDGDVCEVPVGLPARYRVRGHTWLGPVDETLDLAPGVERPLRLA